MVNIGDRVRLHGPTPTLRLQSALGSIARRDERYGDVGYWVVRLDQAATSIDGKGEAHTLIEVVEHEDNLTPEERLMEDTATRPCGGACEHAGPVRQLIPTDCPSCGSRDNGRTGYRDRWINETTTFATCPDCGHRWLVDHPRVERPT